MIEGVQTGYANYSTEPHSRQLNELFTYKRHRLLVFLYIYAVNDYRVGTSDLTVLTEACYTVTPVLSLADSTMVQYTVSIFF